MVTSTIGFLVDCAVVPWLAIHFFLLAPRDQRNTARQLELKRRELNDRTFDALAKTLDLTRRVPKPVFDELAELNVEQIVMQKEIEDGLAADSIRREQGLRAASAAVLLQAAILMRRVELFCSDLAAMDAADDVDDQHADDVCRFARGDLDKVGECYGSVVQRFLRPLSGRDMRRERVARQFYHLLTFRLAAAFDRDTGVSDIRQQLRNLQASRQELRAEIKLAGSDYLTRALDAAAETYADKDDESLVRRVIQIIDVASKNHLNPTDENYPVLIWRLTPIRTKFSELPAWRWTLAWTAYVAVLQAWLYLFAMSAAEADGDAEAAEQLSNQASTASGLAATMVAELALLERGLKPLVSRLSMLGRQKVIRGFGEPPTRERLRELLDDVQVRINAHPTQRNRRK